MPRLKKANGTLVNSEIFVKSWITIPVEPNKKSTPITSETYLVSARVADYINLLETKFNLLPKLKPMGNSNYSNPDQRPLEEQEPEAEIQSEDNED